MQNNCPPKVRGAMCPKPKENVFVNRIKNSKNYFSPQHERYKKANWGQPNLQFLHLPDLAGISIGILQILFLRTENMRTVDQKPEKV